jgi:hypothetical protein
MPEQTQKALKAFLPQLIGEMMCCARSRSFRAINTDDGLLLGIGVTGFDVCIYIYMYHNYVTVKNLQVS